MTITGGQEVTTDGPRVVHAPKKDLIAACVAALQGDRLKIAREMPEAQTLVDELLAFRITVNIATGNASFAAWRERDHDDLVLSVARAVWYRDWWNAHLERWQHRGVYID